MNNRIKIISEENLPVPSNVPPPPPAELNHIEMTPVTPTPPPTPREDARLIQFSDMSKIYVKREWLMRCPILAENIIFFDFEAFKKYIYPILNNDSLRWSKNMDEAVEIGQMISEICKYQLTLTPQQVQDISDGAGITRMINRILNYITKHENKCWTKAGYKERYQMFVKEWNRYVELLAIQYKDEMYNQYKAELIYNTLTSNNMYQLLQANIQKNNIVYEYCSWFDLFMIQKKETFLNHIYETASNIDIASVAGSVTDITTVILNLINGIGSETIRKNVLVQKIADLVTIRRLNEQQNN